MKLVQQMLLDPATNQIASRELELPNDATQADLEAAFKLFDDAGWTQIRLANRRKYIASTAVKYQRLAQINRARQHKVKIHEADILSEDKAIATSLAKLEAEIRADAELMGQDPDAVVLDLQRQAMAARTNGTTQ